MASGMANSAVRLPLRGPITIWPRERRKGIDQFIRHDRQARNDAEPVTAERSGWWDDVYIQAQPAQRTVAFKRGPQRRKPGALQAAMHFFTHCGIH